MLTNEKIGIIGLGYVGLPVALAFAKKYQETIGFDINTEKIKSFKAGIDTTGDIAGDELKTTKLKFTANIQDLKGCSFFVVAVPTPIDQDRRPDLQPLIKASELLAQIIQEGAIIVYESTVYPGVTEEICGPILAQKSGLKAGQFKLGYSPERINPGDKEHTLEKIVKVVSAEDGESLDRVAKVYGSIIDAGIHKASSIKVAEAAKVIENTQRDLNIALMNELSLIFDRLGIRTKEVLEAAGTKWNFLKFSPGLVGGHCIGVDPYYLTNKAEQIGYHPQVILAGRRINDDMGKYVAQRIVKLMVNAGVHIKHARVGILGLTFKENVSDLRNSRVPDIVNELREFGVIPLVHDAVANAEEAKHEYGINLVRWEQLSGLDGLILAVPHQAYLDKSLSEIVSRLDSGGVFVDVKSAFEPSSFPKDIVYWSL